MMSLLKKSEMLAKARVSEQSTREKPQVSRNYQQFVKAEMAKMKSSKLPVGQRMKHIGKLWAKHKTKALKGGDIETEGTPAPAPKELTEQEKLGQMLQDKENEFEEKIKKSLYGQYGTPYIKPTVMMDRGIPWILAQHPNMYSANPNLVLLYRNLSQFIKSLFYKKYSNRFVEVDERSGYGRTSSKIIPGKDFRIVFRSFSKDDNTQYYLDCKDEDEFMDVLDEAKESNILFPVEFVSKKFMDLNKQLTQKEVEESNKVWEAGYQNSFDKLEPIIKQQQQDIQNLQQQLQDKQSSSSDSDWLSDIAEGALMVAKVLI